MEKEQVKNAAIIIGKAALHRHQQGKEKSWVSLEGYLALMADKIERWFEHRNHDEILELALDATFAVARLLPAGEVEQQHEEPDVEELRRQAKELLDDETTEPVED